jgi:hypothetical protein
VKIGLAAEGQPPKSGAGSSVLTYEPVVLGHSASSQIWIFQSIWLALSFQALTLQKYRQELDKICDLPYKSMKKLRI